VQSPERKEELMKNLARAIATAGIAVAIGVITVPSAAAAAQSAAPAKSSAQKSAQKKVAKPAATMKKAATKAAKSSGAVTIYVYNVYGNGNVTSEQGPGNLANAEVDANGPVDMPTQNEPIRTGDLNNNTDGDNNESTFEVEGSEQDEGELS
jgi:hypothetical protein